MGRGVPQVGWKPHFAASDFILSKIHVQDVTADLQLCGVHTITGFFRGPTPRSLVTHVAATLAVPSIIPVLPPALLRYTPSRPSVGAGIATNW